MVSRLKQIFGINVLENCKKIYEQNGASWKSCYWLLYITDDLKFGKYVGKDQLGNKYFENPYYFFGRNRWVVYNLDVGLNYDAAQVPAEWFGWLHYKTDYTPCEDPGRPVYKWMADHTENLTATNKQYVPYTSTRAKIRAWQPSHENVRKIQTKLDILDVETWQNRREKEAAASEQSQEKAKTSEVGNKNNEDCWQPKH